MAYALGSALGPVIGGKLTDLYGFRSCADIMAVFTLIYGCINFGLVFVPTLFCSKDLIDIKLKTIQLSDTNSLNFVTDSN